MTPADLAEGRGLLRAIEAVQSRLSAEGYDAIKADYRQAFNELGAFLALHAGFLIEAAEEKVKANGK